MVEIVLGGLRETAIEAPERLARLEALTLEMTPRGERLRHELKRAFGDVLVGAVAQRATMIQLERVAGDRAQPRMAIDSLVLGDAVVSVVT